MPIVSIPDKLEQELQNLIETTGRTRAYHVRRALQLYIHVTQCKLSVKAAKRQGQPFPWDTVRHHLAQMKPNSQE